MPNGHYLAESKQVKLLTSARDIVLLPVKEKNHDAVIFAAPDFGEPNSKNAKIISGHNFFMIFLLRE